jgi:hypothetical protein
MAESGDFERFSVTTGSEEEATIIERQNSFFATVLGKLGVELSNPFVEINRNPLGQELSDGFYPSEDILHSLTLSDETLAIVLDRRNSNNFHVVTFFERSPSKQLFDFISRMRSAKEKLPET